MPKMRPGGFVKTKPKPSALVLVLGAAALYGVAYGMYWVAAWMVDSPRDFHHLWSKALILPGIAAAAFYFNKTNQSRGN